MGNVRDLFAERSVSGALSYQVPEEANSLDWWKRLIDECADNGVTHVDPCLFLHWGLDYPSDIFPEFRNPTCRNANPKTEYLPDLIRYAHQKGLKVNLRVGGPFGTFHPGKEHTLLQVNQKGHYLSFTCPDKDVVAERVVNLILEVVNRYGKAELGKDSVDGIYFDNFRYCDGAPCWCPDTKRRFKETFGEEYKDTSEEKRIEYMSHRIASILKEVNKRIKEINSELEIGMTEVAAELGNMPEFIRPEETGLEFVIFQVFGRHYVSPGEKAYYQGKERIESYSKYFKKVGTELECRHMSSFSAGTLSGHYWDAIPIMFTGLRTACRLKEELKEPEKFQVLTFFNITAVPEWHINRKAMFEAFNCEVEK